MPIMEAQQERHRSKTRGRLQRLNSRQLKPKFIPKGRPTRLKRAEDQGKAAKDDTDRQMLLKQMNKQGGRGQIMLS